MNDADAGRLALATGPAALLFVAVFLAGDRVHPLRSLVRDRSTVLSFTAGMSAAYVFLRMMPELHETRRDFVEAAEAIHELPYEGMAIYFLALLGFLASYGLDRLRPGREAAGAGTTEHGLALLAKSHLLGLAAYAALTSCLLVRDAAGSVAATTLYALAFGGHFLALDHSLFEEYGAAYRRVGRWVMAGACLLGWLAGVLLALPAFGVALLTAFISGGVIMTNALMELAAGKDGRFLPFLAGSVLYGLMLIPLG